MEEISQIYTLEELEVGIARNQVARFVNAIPKLKGLKSLTIHLVSKGTLTACPWNCISQRMPQLERLGVGGRGLVT